ncbi:hypothetical protein Tco_0305064 [Tanacetum coccineum]
MEAIAVSLDIISLQSQRVQKATCSIFSISVAGQYSVVNIAFTLLQDPELALARRMILETYGVRFRIKNLVKVCRVMGYDNDGEKEIEGTM